MEAKKVGFVFAILVLFGLGRSDLSKDREKCADQLVGLATCLPYVGGDAKTPTIDCCTGLKQVLDKSKECLCILVKDRDDPALGLKINATLALGLPSKCQSPANVSDCPALLHLTPNSPDAKVFEDFDKGFKGSNTTASSAEEAKGNSSGTPSSADEKSNNGVRPNWLGVEIALGLIFVVASLV